jgi:transposase-like protein
MDTVHSAITEPVRRLEVFTGAGRRRKWSEEDKAGIVAEIVASGDSVCAVARRHGLSPQQLFGSRRQLRTLRLGIPTRKNCSLCRRWRMGSHRHLLAAAGTKHRDGSLSLMLERSKSRSMA